jgi:hypothetical protein
MPVLPVVPLLLAVPVLPVVPVLLVVLLPKAELPFAPLSAALLF